MLKNSIVTINKTASIAGFHKIETDGELFFNNSILQNFFIIEVYKKVGHRFVILL
ncbi:conserved hypothetical protein [Leptospira interrogans serovar Manilae]|uniref:Uncharacterized protein n=1 Tax=Leptospira interrogans serovar Manilae TaxID=214675 RepID=A0AAQ1P215_LEPIR|nr:conserved hypothetical protein [Leptospira interrogans serovar Manilae]